MQETSRKLQLDWFDSRSVRRSFFRGLLHRRCVLLLLNFAILRRSLHVSVSLAYLQCSSGTSACKVSVANSLIVGVHECPFGTKAAAANLLDHVTPLTVTLSSRLTLPASHMRQYSAPVTDAAHNQYIYIGIGTGGGGGAPGACDPPSSHKLSYKLLTTLCAASNYAPPIKKSFLSHWWREDPGMS